VGWGKAKQQRVFFGFAAIVGKNSSSITLAIWVRLMKMGAATGCHQMHERSFSICGYQFPVCARCTGLGIGQFLGLAFSFILSKYNIIFLLIPALFSLLLLGIDGLGQLKQKWTSTNVRRLITGLLCGFFVMVLFVKAVIELLKMWK
jgi:uncharacterized membrane protein